MKHLVVILVALTSILAYSATPTTKEGKPKRKLNRAKMMESWYRHTGGEIIKPGAQKGCVVFVNAQKDAPNAWINDVATNFAASTKIAIRVQDGAFTFPRPTLIGEATLYIISDPDLPTILHAPENRWTMVNIANLREGNGSKEQFYSERVKKEVTRGFCLLAGAQTSNYPDSLLTSVTKPADLDQFLGCRLQFDLQERFIPYLKGFGITPAKYVTYIEACQQGWAPQPTNDVQKAIWDKVHAVPANPMKIEFDPKKGR